MEKNYTISRLLAALLVIGVVTDQAFAQNRNNRRPKEEVRLTLQNVEEITKITSKVQKYMNTLEGVINRDTMKKGLPSSRNDADSRFATPNQEAINTKANELTTKTPSDSRDIEIARLRVYKNINREAGDWYRKVAEADRRWADLCNFELEAKKWTDSDIHRLQTPAVRRYMQTLKDALPPAPPLPTEEEQIKRWMGRYFTYNTKKLHEDLLKDNPRDADARGPIEIARIILTRQWMDKCTKNVAKVKLSGIDFNEGYPPISTPETGTNQSNRVSVVIDPEILQALADTERGL